MFPQCKKCYGEMKPLFHTEFYCPKCEADPKPVAKKERPNFDFPSPLEAWSLSDNDLDKTVEIDPNSWTLPVVSVDWNAYSKNVVDRISDVVGTREFTMTITPSFDLTAANVHIEFETLREIPVFERADYGRGAYYLVGSTLYHESPPNEIKVVNPIKPTTLSFEFTAKLC